MYCICCKENKIKPLGDKRTSEEDHIWFVENKELDEQGKTFFKREVLVTDVNSRMWDGGIAHKIDAGYGSEHDTDSFVIAICDDCITENLEDGTLLFHSNYMNVNPSSKEYDNELVNKSKTIFRRRKNLDGLV